MKGYELVAALKKEAEDIATDSRRELVLEAAREIEALLKRERELEDTIDAWKIPI